MDSLRNYQGQKAYHCTQRASGRVSRSGGSGREGRADGAGTREWKEREHEETTPSNLEIGHNFLNIASNSISKPHSPLVMDKFVGKTETETERRWKTSSIVRKGRSGARMQKGPHQQGHLFSGINPHLQDTGR